MVPYLRAANVGDGTLDLSDVKTMNFTPTEQEIYRLKCGDVLVTEGSGSLSAVGASAVWNGEVEGIVCFQNTLLRMRPRSTTDPRFLAWWSRYAYDDGLYASLSTGANIHHLSAERVRSVPVTFPDEQEQRAIADFLDAETARIDSLIAKKLGERDLLASRLRSECDAAFADVAHLVQLRRLVSRLTSGPRGWAQHFSENGAPFLTIGNVKRNDIELDMVGVTKVDPPAGAESARTRVRYGDVVLSITADIGSVGIVREYDGYVSQHLALMSPDKCSSEWLAYALYSPAVRSQLDSLTYGGTKVQLALEDVAAINVPTPSVAQHDAIVARLQRSRTRTFRVLQLLDEQIELLRERRRALITAAVTGQMAVPGVEAA